MARQCSPRYLNAAGEAKYRNPGKPTSYSSWDSCNSPLHRRIASMWVFRAGQRVITCPRRRSKVLTVCDHTAGMDPIVSDLWGCPLNLDGCYVSRGKTTPTLHFLCLHGSHAIDAVSMPSSLMLLTTVESRGRRYASGAPVRQLATEKDGGNKAARSEQSARCSRPPPVREQPLPCERPGLQLPELASRLATLKATSGCINVTIPRNTDLGLALISRESQ